MPRARNPFWTAPVNRWNIARGIIALLFLVAAFRMALALRFLVGPINFPGRYPAIEANPLGAALAYCALAVILAIAFDRMGRSRKRTA